jgi:hypothetical protein
MLRMEEDALDAERRAQNMGRIPAEDGRSLPMAGLSGPCEEAAALYAAGRSRDAANVLTSELNNKKGACPQALWYMLMDIYQATGQHAAFEKLAMFFAKVFNTSPPSWEEIAVQQVGFGRNVLIVEGAARDIHPEKVRDFLQAGKSLKQARLDLSRAKLDGTVDDPMISVRRLIDILPRIRRQKISVFLMGETQMMTDIRARLRTPDGENDALWLLLFELMQWRGQEESFEDLAVEYAQRFDRCAPGYELDGAIALAPEELAPVSETRWTESGDTLTPPHTIAETDTQTLLDKLEDVLARNGSIRLDVSQVKLIEYDAAVALGRFLGVAGNPRENVIISRPSELVRVLLDIVGATQLVSIEPRRR